MKVCKNPLIRPNGRALEVRHPETYKPFPDGVFDLTDRDLRNPAVLRLLPPPPRGRAGGRYGDLLPLPLEKAEQAAFDAAEAARAAAPPPEDTSAPQEPASPDKPAKAARKGAGG